MIQFLVTCVHPRPGGLGVKRRYPLMLNESPPKKSKRVNNVEGPTIHELDSADLLSEELLQDDSELAQVLILLKKNLTLLTQRIHFRNSFYIFITVYKLQKYIG